MSAVTTNIKATSRVAIKIKDNYYTIEYTEERLVSPDTEDVSAERKKLFDDVNEIVDSQANEIYETFAK